MTRYDATPRLISRDLEQFDALYRYTRAEDHPSWYGLTGEFSQSRWYGPDRKFGERILPTRNPERVN